MKLHHSLHRRCRGFTLAEILTAMAIFLILVAVTVSLQLFGLRMTRISEAKLSSSDNARHALNRVRDEIRSATLLYVGQGDKSSFTVVSNTLPCAGNALKIISTDNTNNFVCYYLDPASNCLMRRSSAGGPMEVVSRYVTNQIVFRAEDFSGNVVTNNYNNRIIRMNLEFYRLEFPLMAGNASMHDYYRVQTRIARRAL